MPLEAQEIEELRRNVQLYESGAMEPLTSHSRTLLPFSLEIQSPEMTKSLKIPKKRYNWTTDPYDHVEEFEPHLDAFGVADEAKCKAFPITLKRNA